MDEATAPVVSTDAVEDPVIIPGKSTNSMSNGSSSVGRVRNRVSTVFPSAINTPKVTSGASRLTQSQLPCGVW